MRLFCGGANGKGCNRYTPCGMPLSNTTPITEDMYEASRHGMFSRQRNAGLVISGPIRDGFWTRAKWVMAHIEWAQLVRVPFKVDYRSSRDNYYAKNASGDGWTQYFEPIHKIPSGFKLVALDCSASARAWEYMAGYTRDYRDYRRQVILRSSLIDTIPIRPREHFVKLADAFWNEYFTAASVVLGVHIRGTDHLFKTSLDFYLPFVRDFVCAHPGSDIFLSTDDTKLLKHFLNATAQVPTRVITTSSIRSTGHMNAGVHAHRLGLSENSETLGTDVMVDTILLSRTTFLLKGISSVSEFATYLSPHLRRANATFNFGIKSGPQPLPAWKNACTRTIGNKEKKVIRFL